MKIRAKIFATILAVLMLLSVVPVSFAAEETIVLSDIDASTTVGKAVNELVKLGIINGYEDGTFRPDNTIKRGEFAKIVVTFLGLQDVASETATSGFSDVDTLSDGTSHWAKKYIKLAADKKIVNGYGDGIFKPDADVKYVEVVKMLVCALGYGEIAESSNIEGGLWYSGYMAQASDLGILSKASVNNIEDPAPRGIVAILTNNSLSVPIATTSSTGKVTIDKNQTALEKYQKKEEVSGIVTAVQQTGLNTGATGLTRREITLQVGDEEITYLVPVDTNTMDYLGRRVTGYLEDDDDNKKITQITVDKTTVTKLTPDMELSVDGNTIKYYASESSSRASTVSFENDIRVIYNGKYDATYNCADFDDIQTGSIEFICNDNDGDAEVAIVEEYKNYVVSTVDKNSNPPIVYDKYGNGEVTVPYEDKNIFFSLQKVGSSDEPERIVSSLAAWNILSVAQSKSSAEGKAVWKGYVSTNKISNKEVTGKRTDTRTIDNKTYKLAYNFINFNGSKPQLDTGEFVTVYLDFEGKIAAATSSSTNTSLESAFIVNAEPGMGVNGEASILFYGLSGKYTKERELKLAKTVRVDGVSMQNHDEILATLKAVSQEFKAERPSDIQWTDYSQFVQYTVNSEGRVNMIDTAKKNSGESEDSLTCSVSCATKLQYADGGKLTDNNGQLVMSVNSSTKVLAIPKDTTAYDKYTIKSYGSVFTVGTSYWVEGYNVSSIKNASFVICYNNDKSVASIGENAPMIIVDEIIEEIDSETGLAVDKVVGTNFRNGTELVGVSEEKGLISGKYSFGDIFRYASTDGKIAITRPVLKFGETAPTIYGRDGVTVISAPITGEADAAAAARKASETRMFQIDDSASTALKNSVGRFVYGTVLGREDNDILLTTTIAQDEFGVLSNDTQTFSIDGAKIYLYDYTAKGDNRIVTDASVDTIQSLDQLEKANVSDPDQKASQVLVFHTGVGTVKAVIVFKY
ncbi:MAG: S-layer homology domain-containing protein [Clostridia bacterium]|nr:S-layer homology domain-containing protein [Clostridia bacterium]